MRFLIAIAMAIVLFSPAPAQGANDPIERAALKCSKRFFPSLKISDKSNKLEKRLKRMIVEQFLTVIFVELITEPTQEGRVKVMEQCVKF